jgi:Zn finger protein HypA/HybF involved in hydrogenase expression
MVNVEGHAPTHEPARTIYWIGQGKCPDCGHGNRPELVGGTCPQCGWEQ